MDNQLNESKAVNKVITVNTDKCIGCGLCVSTCPDVFELDDNGKSRVKDSNSCEKCNCEEVIDNCPAKAISWEG